jgi:hypothetical protein
VHYNGDNISPNTSNVDTNSADPCTHGTAGIAVNYVYNNGSSITVNTNQNPTTKIAIWNTGTPATNDAIFVYGTFGAGKFVTSGDSTPFDDGTGTRTIRFIIRKAMPPPAPAMARSS